MRAPTVGALLLAAVVIASLASSGGGSMERLPAGVPDPEAPVLTPTPTASPVPTPTPPATPVPTPTSSPQTSIVPPHRPAMIDRPVPERLLATLALVARAMPRPYRDGCHGAAPLSTRCQYGSVRSKTTIVLFGDSHALAWIPAVERVARDLGWRLISVTRSACPPARLRSFSRATQQVVRSCITWRERAIARIRQLRPRVVLLTGSRGFIAADASGRILTGDARTRAWERGMASTLRALVPRVRRAILLADLPNSRWTSPARCLRENPRHSIRCATPVSRAISYQWLNVEVSVARASNAGFINTELWVCPTTPCPAIVSGTLVHRNPGHLTVSFPRTQWRRLARAILRELG